MDEKGTRRVRGEKGWNFDKEKEPRMEGTNK